LIDMHHNMSFRERHVYHSKKALAVALTRAFEKRGDGRVGLIRSLVGQPALAQVTDMWFSPGPQSCKFMACAVLPRVEKDELNDEEWLKDDVAPNYNGTGVPLSADQNSTPLGRESGLDGIEDLKYVDLELEEIARDAEPRTGDTPEEETERLCRAYQRMYIKRGQRQALKSLSNNMKSLSSLVAWMACKSLNKFTTLQMVVQYAARKPFTYVDVASGETMEVEPFFCSCLVVSNLTEGSPAVFKWKQTFLKDAANLDEINDTIREWKEAIYDYHDANELAAPTHVAFIPDTHHYRGCNFLLVYTLVDYAAASRRKEVQILDRVCRITAVVNRRMKLWQCPTSF
jgi:hypothetical protein